MEEEEFSTTLSGAADGFKVIIPVSVVWCEFRGLESLRNINYLELVLALGGRPFHSHG